jgi:hypothetical protein
MNIPLSYFCKESAESDRVAKEFAAQIGIVTHAVAACRSSCSRKVTIARSKMWRSTPQQIGAL